MPKKSHSIAKKTYGSGQPVLLLHGFAGSHKHWNKVIINIPQDKFHIIAPDSIGFGISDKPSKLSYDIDDHSMPLAKNILKEINEPIILVGHSMGAMIALRIAKLHPGKVNKLVLINPPIFRSPEHAKQVIRDNLTFFHKIYVSKLGSPIYLVRNNPLIKHLISSSLTKDNNRSDIVGDYFNHSRRSFIRSIRNTLLTYSMYDDLEQIAVPTKYIYSHSDPLFDPTSLELIKKFLNIQAVEISGGHEIPFVNANAVAQEICT